MKKENGDGPLRNIIAQGTKIQGDIDSSGDFRIEGSLTGTVKVKGKIVIGESGVVEGNILCQSADISGKAKVKMEVAELTSLRATSNFVGEISTKKLSIEPGAIFSGTCQMGSVPVPKQAEKTESKPVRNPKLSIG